MTAATLRSSSIAYVSNASSGSVTLPVGVAAGDTCFLFVEHGYSANTPTGWSIVDRLTGTNINGAIFSKELTSTDITAGSVTVSFAGVYYGIIAAAAFVGPVVVRTVKSARNSTGATSRSLSTTSVPAVDDYALYFGSGRFNGTITSSAGTSLQTSSNANASAVLAGATLTASGVTSSTYSFSATPTGDYEAIAVVYAEPVGEKITKAGAVAVSYPNAGTNVTKAGMVAVMRTPVRNEMTKSAVVVVMRPAPAPASDRRRMSFM